MSGGMVWRALRSRAGGVRNAGMEHELDLARVSGPEIGERPVETDQKTAAHAVDLDDQRALGPGRQVVSEQRRLS